MISKIFSPNYTFKTRLFLCFSSFSLLFILWACVYFFVDFKQKQLSEFSLKLNTIQTDYLKSIDNLDRFMIAGFHDPKFYKTEHQQDIDQFLTIQKTVSANLSDLKKISSDISLGANDHLDTLSKLNKNILLSGSQLRYHYFKKGFVDYGTEGEMRAHAHWIEDYGKIQKVDILQLRRHEKDFIMRGKALYANEYYGTIDSLIRLRHSKDSTYLELSNYEKAFRALVGYTDALGIFTNTGIVPNTQHYIYQFNQVFNNTYSISTRTMSYLRNRLRILIVIVSVIFIVSAFLLSAFLSEFLTVDVKELDQRMDAFRNSDFKQADNLSAKNDIKPRSIEVQRLFDDFENLKTTLLDHINNLNQQTDDLQCLNEELQAQSEELKTLNEELIEQRGLEDEANQRYHLVTKATSDAIWDWDLTADTLTWGEGFNTIFGYNITHIHPATELLKTFLHPEDTDRVMEGIRRVINSKESNWKEEYQYIKADGTYAYVIDRGFIIRDQSGKAIRMVGAMQDISARKKEEHHLKLLRSVITNANDAVIIAEPGSDGSADPSILYVNEAFSSMTGYEGGEVIGRSPRMLQGPKSNKLELLRLSAAIKNWQKREITTINYKKTGEEFWANISVSPVTDEKGVYTHVIAIIRDITAKKKAELDMQLFADDLFSRNKELHQFGYVVSHNLRSPIANIMGITNLLELDMDDPETLRKCTKDLKTAVNSLDSVVKDLSKILTITDGSVELTKETLDLALILDNVKNDLNEVLQHSKASVEIPTASYFIFSHKAYLYSIFYNLISNAIKYKSKSDPEIKISVSATAGYLLVTVADNGIGIDLKKHSEDLFKPYKRFNLGAEGKGLGLFLVKSHIESLKGTISISSEVGVGTAFAIKLPLHIEPQYLNN